jgi:hypothetical protein
MRIGMRMSIAAFNKFVHWTQFPLRFLALLRNYMQKTALQFSQ